MSNINSRNISKANEELYLAFNNLIAFGKIILSAGQNDGGDFLKTKPTPKFHRIIAKELLAKSKKPLALILPRGSAKTTLTKAKILHDLCFAKNAKKFGLSDKEHNLFFGWCADSKAKSQKNVSFIKLHLKYNPLIKYYFGNMEGKVWNQQDIETSWGDRLISTSNLTSLRGDTLATLFDGSIRYSGVFIDDAESEKNTISENARNRIVDNILNGIMPAIEKVDMALYDSWFVPRMFFSGTPVHFDSFCQKLLDEWIDIVKEYGGTDPLNYTEEEEELKIRKMAENEFQWRVIAFRSTQPNLPGGVLWYPYKSRKILDEELKLYEINNVRGVAGYYQEMELEVTRDEDALIGRNALKYWKGNYEYEEKNKTNYLFINGSRIIVNTFLGCDPATDIDKKDSDFSVIMVIAMDAKTNIYVIHYERHRAIPTLGIKNNSGVLIGKKGVVDYIVELYKKYRCSSGVVEDVAMNRSIFPAINQYKILNNDWSLSIIGEPAPPTMSKLDRIYTGLSHKFASGQIYVLENHYSLINEIVKFGNKMGHDDTIEALYYSCRRAYPPPNKKIDDSNVLASNIYPVARDWQL